jgi:hypothetical protein
MEGAICAPANSDLVIDKQVSVSVADRLGILIPVGQDHRVQDLTASDTMPGMEEDLSGIVSEILKALFHHQSFTARACHGTPPYLIPVAAGSV